MTTWLSPDQARRLLEQASNEWERHRARWIIATLGNVDIEGRGAPRPEQLPIGDDWFAWFILGGRGSGKTRAGAEDVSDFARRHADTRLALVAPRFADVRDTMVEGETGLLSVLPPSALRNGSAEDSWNRSLGEFFFANGTQAKAFSSEKPGNLRGPQHHRAWVDEPAEFADAHLGDALDTTWNNLMFGMRLGEHPQVVVTGTPKRNKLILELVQRAQTDRRVRLLRCSTYDNLHNLAQSFRDEILSRYEGTRIGRQELDAEILEDVEGALWSQELLEDLRRDPTTVPEMRRRVVAVDPSLASTGGECGIVVCGLGTNGLGYVLDDRSVRAKPSEWAKVVVDTFHDWECHSAVVEQNLPGRERVRDDLSAVPGGDSVHVTDVRASVRKEVRAGPVVALCEQQKILLAGSFPFLERQLTEWVPGSGPSPDRLDAFVWGFHHLMVKHRLRPATTNARQVRSAVLPSAAGRAGFA